MSTKTAQSNQPVDLTQAMAKVQAIRSELTDRFIERGSEVDVLFTSLLSGQHCLLLGPAGEGKSAVVDALRARIVGATGYKKLVFKTTTPDEVIGIPDIAAFKQGRYVRVTANKLPSAHIAFMDEIFKANSTLLNAFLGMMNEREFEQDGQMITVPLEMMVGASNEMPQSDDLGALWDRFLARTWVQPLSQAGRRQFVGDEMTRRVTAASTPGADTSGKRGTTLSLQELQALQAAALAVAIPEAVQDVYWKIEQQMQVQSIELPSTRRLGWLWSLVGASALLNGRTTATDDDLMILRFVLWQTRSQIKPVTILVMEAASPLVAKAQGVFDKLIAEIEEVILDEKNVTDAQSETAHATKVVTVERHAQIAMNDLMALRDQARGAGRDASPINQMGKEVNAKLAALRSKQQVTW